MISRNLAGTIFASPFPGGVQCKIDCAWETPDDRVDVLASQEGDDHIDGPDHHHSEHHRVANPVGHRILPAIRSEKHTAELQALMRQSSAAFCLNKKTKQ